MKTHKLVLIFNDGSEVSGIPKVLVFNNELDATYYLSDKGLSKIKFELEDEWFSFSHPAWDGNGKAYWAEYIL